MSLKRISFTVDGLVQGVNYRNFAKKQATNLGVTGFVQNDTGGTVSGEAQGDDGKISGFVAHLKQGPSAAQVENVSKETISVKEGETDFSVHRN